MVLSHTPSVRSVMNTAAVTRVAKKKTILKRTKIIQRFNKTFNPSTLPNSNCLRHNNTRGGILLKRCVKRWVDRCLESNGNGTECSGQFAIYHQLLRKGSIGLTKFPFQEKCHLLVRHVQSNSDFTAVEWSFNGIATVVQNVCDRLGEVCRKVNESDYVGFPRLRVCFLRGIEVDLVFGKRWYLQ